jgi:hypothetical protein
MEALTLVLFWMYMGALGMQASALMLMTFLMYRRVEVMETLLSRCALVSEAARAWRNRRMGRMIRLHAIAITVLCPKLTARRGQLDWQQFRAFPRVLRLMLGASYSMLVVGTTVLIVAAVIARFYGR